FRTCLLGRCRPPRGGCDDCLLGLGGLRRNRGSPAECHPVLFCVGSSWSRCAPATPSKERLHFPTCRADLPSIQSSLARCAGAALDLFAAGAPWRSPARRINLTFFTWLR